MLLTIETITKNFGGLSALQELSLEVKAGEILGLIGPNGSGKTTLFNVISGFLPPSTGKIFFNGEDITGLSPGPDSPERAGSHLPGKRSLYAAIGLGQSDHRPSPDDQGQFLGLLLNRSQGQVRRSGCRQERSGDIRTYLDLLAVKDEAAQNLPHGYQRALGVAIALAAQPRLLLLDEPLTGMNPEESRSLSD